MRVLTINELLRLTRQELCDLAARTAALPEFPEGSVELKRARQPAQHPLGSVPPCPSAGLKFSPRPANSPAFARTRRLYISFSLAATRALFADFFFVDGGLVRPCCASIPTGNALIPTHLTSIAPQPL
jgi:hypothetical protein